MTHQHNLMKQEIISPKKQAKVERNP